MSIAEHIKDRWLLEQSSFAGHPAEFKGQRMKVTLALLADYANIEVNGKLNVLGIFERVRAAQFPANHPEMHLVFRTIASIAERGKSGTVDIQLVDADGQLLFRITGTYENDANQTGASVDNQIIKLNNLVFPHPGDYAFHIFLDDDEKQTVPFTVEAIVLPSLDDE